MRTILLLVFLPACGLSYEPLSFPEAKPLGVRDGSGGQATSGTGGAASSVASSGGFGGAASSSMASSSVASSNASASSSNGGVACAHDPCAAGVGLDPTCDPCAAYVCGLAANCCTGAWDAGCLSLANQIHIDGTSCHGSCPGTSCSHSPCVGGAPLAGEHDNACSFVVYNVCRSAGGDMPECCAPDGAWTPACVTAAIGFGQVC